MYMFVGIGWERIQRRNHRFDPTFDCNSHLVCVIVLRQIFQRKTTVLMHVLAGTVRVQRRHHRVDPALGRN
jgi:hypothetical protein